jgi:hypothetical protein
MIKQQSIYIAGQVTGDPGYEAKFSKSEKNLRESFSGKVVNPVRELQNEFIFPEQQPWHVLMLSCLKRLSACTHIYMLPDYYKSTGACIELEWARKLGLIIIYHDKPEKAA